MKIDSDQFKNEIEGVFSIKLKSGKLFDDFCERNFSSYERAKFEPIAVRFCYDEKASLVLYAVNKDQENDVFNSNTLSVKKFKSEDLPLEELLSFIKEFNFQSQNTNRKKQTFLINNN